MHNRIRVGVLMGGATPEYEVSRKAGDVVMDSLDREKYEVIPVFISRSGEWSIPIDELQNQIDIAYLTLRGRHDGGAVIQSALKDYNIPYTGSDVLPSALAMNKILSNRLFSSHGFNVPRFTSASNHDWQKVDLRGFDYPLIVKPADVGSSLGVSIARNDGELHNALTQALQFSKDVLIQEFIPGHEVSCTVIDDGMGDIIPLPVSEIVSTSGIYDYERKHTASFEHHITPGRFTEHGAQYIQEIAGRLHNLIGASGISRTDMIITEGDDLYVLEINTAPHATEFSPMLGAATSHGLSAGEFVDRILDAGMRKHGLLLSELS